MHTVAFRTFGCKLNQAETAMLQWDFENKGYRVVRWNEGADVSVINTCSVTARSDAKCRQAIRHVLKLTPETTLIVVGCYSQMAADDVCRIPGVDYIFGTQEKLRLFDNFPGPGKCSASQVFVSPVKGTSEVLPHEVGDYLDHTRAFLKIQNGCNRRCSYCIVPLARGPSRSLPPEKVISDAAILARKGYREVVLTGVHVGDYGKEWGGRSSLPGLLRDLMGVKGLSRIRLSSIEPGDVSDELLSCVEDSERICRHFHIPLQSGSDFILRTMNRSYTKAVFREKAEKIAAKFPDVCLGTDTMVGFPGETDKFFEETVQLIESLPLAHLHVFSFSARKGTKAAFMKTQIPPQVRAERARRLRRIGEQKKKDFMERWLHRTVGVLLECRDLGGWLSGFSSEYLRVEVPYDETLRNQLVSVRIGEIMSSAVRGGVVGG